jgi:hypothetical protein
VDLHDHQKRLLLALRDGENRPGGRTVLADISDMCGFGSDDGRSAVMSMRLNG